MSERIDFFVIERVSSEDECIYGRYYPTQLTSGDASVAIRLSGRCKNLVVSYGYHTRLNECNPEYYVSERESNNSDLRPGLLIAVVKEFYDDNGSDNSKEYWVVLGDVEEFLHGFSLRFTLTKT